jgi:hypothetical protein
MPIRRFRTVEEMSQASATAAHQGSVWERIAILWRLALRLGRHRVAPGVRRFKRIDDRERQRYR